MDVASGVPRVYRRCGTSLCASHLQGCGGRLFFLVKVSYNGYQRHWCWASSIWKPKSNAIISDLSHAYLAVHQTKGGPSSNYEQQSSTQ